jgi:hypothetical protein
MVNRYRRSTRCAAELNGGWLRPMNEIIPELSAGKGAKRRGERREPRAFQSGAQGAEPTEDGGLTHGFLARLDHTGALTAQAVIKTTDKHTGLTVAAIGENSQFIFQLMSAKGDFELVHDDIDGIQVSSDNIEPLVETLVLVRYSKDGQALELLTIATHPTTPFKSLSLQVNDRILIAYFQGGEVTPDNNLGLETPGASAIKVADSGLAGGAALVDESRRQQCPLCSTYHHG